MKTNNLEGVVISNSYGVFDAHNLILIDFWLSIVWFTINEF